MNIIAIALATLASFVIGFVWFNGKTFYPVWYRALGKEVPQRPEVLTEADKREAGQMFGRLESGIVPGFDDDEFIYGGSVYLAGRTQAGPLIHGEQPAPGKTGY